MSIIGSSSSSGPHTQLPYCVEIRVGFTACKDVGCFLGILSLQEGRAGFRSQEIAYCFTEVAIDQSLLLYWAHGEYFEWSNQPSRPQYRFAGRCWKRTRNGRHIRYKKRTRTRSPSPPATPKITGMGIYMPSRNFKIISNPSPTRTWTVMSSPQGSSHMQ